MRRGTKEEFGPGAFICDCGKCRSDRSASNRRVVNSLARRKGVKASGRAKTAGTSTGARTSAETSTAADTRTAANTGSAAHTGAAARTGTTAAAAARSETFAIPRTINSVDLVFAAYFPRIQIAEAQRLAREWKPTE